MTQTDKLAGAAGAHGRAGAQIYPGAIIQRTRMVQMAQGCAAWWNPDHHTENIGDFLAYYFIKTLFVDFRQAADNYRLIGSVISDEIVRSDIEYVVKKPDGRIAFWCCGCRSEQGLSQDLRHHVSIHGVRGPLTRDLLGLPPDTPLGDPALLLPLIYAPKPSARTRGRTIFIPHVSEVASQPADALLRRSGAEVLVSPVISRSLDDVEPLIDDICSAGFVLASSLHGAIIACAYGVPFSFFDAGHVDAPFKWQDFSASIGTGTYFPRTLADAREVHARLLGPRMRRPPLARILDAAPLVPRPRIRALAQQHSWGDGR